MNLSEETIDATLDASGHLQLTHQPSLPPGPVRVTIRAATPGGPPPRGLADVLRDIAAGQRARGFSGRSAEEIRAEEDERQLDDAQRDRDFEVARHAPPTGGP